MSEIEDVDPYAVDEKWRKPRWSHDEIQQAMQLRAALCSDAEIGEYLGRPESGVAAKLRKEIAAVRLMDAVAGRHIEAAVAPLRKVHADALAGAADAHAGGSVPALCRVLIDRLAGRPDVVAMLMEGGR